MNKALLRLMIGFKKFREKNFLDLEHADPSNYQKLAASGQAPKTLLIGCSDSRVDPALLTGANPGEIFVIRNVANLVPPCEPSAVGFHGTSSALEYAVINLKVENILLVGHRQCGGIRTLMPGFQPNPDSFIGHWMSIVDEVRNGVTIRSETHSEDELWRWAEMESIKVSLRNLKSFPFVQQAQQTRSLNIVGVYFDLEQGHLWELDNESQQFQLMEI